MQRYQWPGYELQLLGELQRQQNSAQYCDTLLQAEGVSVPTHSCVLAALSPYFSQELLATPTPPRGQKRHLHLRALKAQTLLKLVGLLYSGQVEVKGPKEQSEVLAAAHRFGLVRLVEGRRHWRTKEEEEQKRRERGACCRESGVQTEGCRKKRQDMRDAQVQTDMAERRVETSLEAEKSYESKSTQTVEAEEKSESSFIDQNQPHSITFDPQFDPTSSPPAACSAELTITSGKTSGSVPVLSSKVMTFSDSRTDDCASTTSAQDDVVLQESFESKDARLEDGEGTEETESFTGKGPPFASAVPNSLKTMKEMMDSAQISVKVKLRRTTEKEVWEVVSIPDSDDDSSVQTSVEQDHFSPAAPQTNLGDAEPLPSSSDADLSSAQEPQLWNPSADLNSSDQIKLDISSSSSSDRLTSHPNSELESVPPPPPPPPPAPAEETDEQIEKLLEDIMMGLNILPNFERDCKKSQTADNSFHYGFPAVNQPCYTSLFPPPPSESSHQQNAGLSCLDLLPSQTPGSAYPDGAAAASLDYPTFPQPPFQDNQHILDFLPHSDGSSQLSQQPFLLPSLDELRLPECLSPLVPSTSSAGRPLLPANLELQPLLLRRAWLAEKPLESLQFPLSDDTRREAEGASVTHNTNPKCSLRDNVAERPLATESQPKETNERSDDGKKTPDIPIKRRRICRNYLQTSSCFFLDCKDLKGIKKSFCSVNLSSNNALLAERREMDAAPRELRQRPDAGPGNVGSEQKVQTRSSVRRSPKVESVKIPQPVVPTSVAIKPAALNQPNNGVLKLRKRGRPPKVKRGKAPSDSAAPVIEIKSDGVEPKEVKVEGLPKKTKPGTNRTSKKRKRDTSGADVVPLKKPNNAESPEPVNADNDDRNPDALKKPRMVTLEEIQKMLQRQNANIKRSKNNNQERKKPRKEGTSEAKVADEKTEDPKVKTVEKTAKRVSEMSTSEESGVVNGEHREVFLHISEEESGMPFVGREETVHSTRSSDDDDVCLVRPFQDDKTASKQKPNVQEREDKGTNAPNAEESAQEKEEEEEVDILICSPVKSPQMRWYEDLLKTIETTDEEQREEEEDAELIVV